MARIFKAFCATCGLLGRLLVDYFRLIGGVWTLSILNPPIVSVFGGSRIGQEHEYSKKAHELAQRLIEHNISVITGGGPGIMQAANCGAFEHNTGTKKKRGKSIGIGVQGLEKEKRNECADAFITTRYFFTRKWLLTRYSTAFIIFPGGYGTLDELFEITTLMQTGKLKRVPIVLFNTAYWKPLLQWVQQAKKEGLLLEKDVDLLFTTDSVDEAFHHLHQHCEHIK
jgi:uncharacterized protein (TIGR00730 family)